jgi:hypothetical protein
MFAQKFGQLFGGKLFTSRIQQHNSASRSAAFGELEKRGFVFESDALGFSKLTQPLQVLIGKGLDRGVLGFADPCNGEFHGQKILTAKVAEETLRSPRKSPAYLCALRGFFGELCG